MSVIILEARSAREGGGLTLTIELFPRLTRILENAGHEVVSFIGPPISARERLARRRAYASATAILHAGNRATPSRARRVVCVQDRLLLEKNLPRVNNTPRYRVRQKLLAPALAVADAVVVPSRSMLEPLDAFRRRYRVPKKPSEVIMHGRPTWPSPPPRALARPMKLLFASHALWHKNFPLLAGLLTAAAAKGAQYRLTMTASPDQMVEGRRVGEWFGDQVEQVEFLGGLHREELPALFESHDVLLFPSLFEAFGLPLIEAMVMNMPIVASDRDWAREVCGDAAQYVDPHDPNGWLDALETIEAGGERINARGLERASRFDWDTAAARYASLLDPSLRLA